MSNISSSNPKSVFIEEGVKFVEKAMDTRKMDEREIYLNLALTKFNTELNQSNPFNIRVYYEKGRVFNLLHDYNRANDCFESMLNELNILGKNDKYKELFVDTVFANGISQLGLNKLEDALNSFNEVIDESPDYADAWYYLAIIYCNPYLYSSNDSNIHFNPSKSREYYEEYKNVCSKFYSKYLIKSTKRGSDKSLKKYQNNSSKPTSKLKKQSLDYFDKCHKLYNVSDLFICIDQILKSGSEKNFKIFVSNIFTTLFEPMQISLEDISKYNRLFINEDSFNNELLKVKFNNKLRCAGFDNDFIIKFKEFDEENADKLINIINYFKYESQLSFSDFSDLITKEVLNENKSIDSFYDNIDVYSKNAFRNKEDQIKKQLKERFNLKYKKQEEKIKSLECEIHDLKELNSELNKNHEEKIKSLECEIHDLKELNSELNKNHEEKIKSLEENVSKYKDNVKNIREENIKLKEVNNSNDWGFDINNIREDNILDKNEFPIDKYDEEVINKFNSGFENFKKDNFDDAIIDFKSIKEVNSVLGDFLVAVCLSRKNSGDAVKSIESSKMLNNSDFKTPNNYFILGNICLSKAVQNDFKKYYRLAKSYYDKSIRDVPKKSYDKKIKFINSAYNRKCFCEWKLDNDDK